MKFTHIEPNPDPQLEQAHRAKCDSYQSRHDAKCHAVLHDFNVGDVVFCANMKPRKLDSKFRPPKACNRQGARGRDLIPKACTNFEFSNCGITSDSDT